MSLRPNPNAVMEDDTPPASSAATASAAPAPTPAPAPAPAPTPAPAPAAPTTTQAVATRAAGAVTAVRGLGNDPFAALKDALVVDFNTLPNLKAEQGSFFERESGTKLGEWLDLQLLSFQDDWAVTPGDSKADKKLARYSNDGITCTDGTPVAEHLQTLKAQGFPNAKLQKRIVLVGALVGTEKNGDAFVGNLHQISLPPTGKAKFEQYKANTAWRASQGTVDAQAATSMRLTATVAKGPDNTSYTLVNFSMRPAA